MQRIPQRKVCRPVGRTTGFSLIEIMIAVVI
ncbi:prepilin-type N-terminal cleavage/methylation domain-containing protein, partial [Alicyclobacillus acidocaldarius]